jgi:hypothetical protein
MHWLLDVYASVPICDFNIYEFTLLTETGMLEAAGEVGFGALSFQTSSY